MALNSLFNLDPTKFTLSKNSGAFRRVGETSRQLSLSELLAGLSAPAVPTNIPEVTPLSDTTKADAEGFTSLRQSTAQNIRNILNAGDLASITNYLMDPSYSARLRASIGQGGNAAKYTAAANAAEGFYSHYMNDIKAPINTYNQQVSAYNAVVDPYKAEYDKYAAEREARVKDYNKSMVNPDLVDKQATETTGDVLAESDLYSQNLHNLMLDRISAQPQIDEMSALFAKGK